MRVLVVEDERLVREMLGESLAMLGHSPHLAGTGEEALRAFRNESFPVVFTDWFLPDMTGGDLTREFRKDPTGASTFIFMLTIREGREAYLQAMEAGVDDFVHKPLDSELLAPRLRLAERWLNLSREVSQLRGLLPICSYCKSIRDADDAWTTLEHYVESHSEAQFSHGVCPTCMERVVKPEMEAFKRGSRSV